jgi:septal ring factor EnvC (AmiA/AmiB activator)
MTTPEDATPSLTAQQQRLMQAQARLQKEWELRDEKLGVLRQALAIEAQANPNFQLQQQIKAEEAELARLTAQLTALESELSPVRAPNNLPYRGALYFVGRDEDLERLHE